jgi:hypothetical protein
MGKYHKLTSMLEEELDKISASGKLGTSSLEVGDKVAHFLKSVKTIEAMDEAEGESYAYEYPMDDGMMMENRSYGRGNSYARGRGSNAKRDSMGRYASRGMNYSRGGYSGNKEAMMEEIEELKSKIEEMED